MLRNTTQIQEKKGCERNTEFVAVADDYPVMTCTTKLDDAVLQWVVL